MGAVNDVVHNVWPAVQRRKPQDGAPVAVPAPAVAAKLDEQHDGLQPALLGRVVQGRVARVVLLVGSRSTAQQQSQKLRAATYIKAIFYFLFIY